MSEEEYQITCKLLDEAYKNVRMASFAIDCIITKIENPELEKLLRKQNEYYLATTTELENLSNELKHEPVDINPMLKGMSFTSIKTKTFLNNESSHIAEMLVQGTTMGITDTIKSKSENPSQNNELNRIVDKIISMEEEFVDSLKKFL